MSHHYSGPNWGFPRGDARLDLTDVYAFPKPGDARKSILIMNVHPSIGENPPGPTTLEPFAAEALYELDIDTNGDSVADIAYRVRFSRFDDGSQSAMLRRVEGASAVQKGERGRLIVEGAPVSTGRRAQVTDARHYRFFAGWRSDPFFFDRRGALNNLRFTGSDFFAEADVCSIALEVPNADLLSGAVGLWHRTLVRASGAGKGWAQAERGAYPLLSFLVLGLSDAEREAYFAGAPADDARYVDSFAHALEHTGGYSPAEALRVAKTLLPEIMPYDPSRPACFPHNGRALSDDAVDAFLTVPTNGRVTGDKVGPHSDLLAEFPYLGPPHDRTVAPREVR
jgi:hypothetical protein